MSMQEQFYAACRRGDLENIKELVEDINPSADHNWGIRIASKQGHLEVVKFLADLPNVDPADNFNEAIQSASSKGHLDCNTELLVESIQEITDKTQKYNVITAGIVNN